MERGFGKGPGIFIRISGKPVLGALILVFMMASDLRGQIILSEVLSNEPAGRVRLEWVEIYNQSAFEIDLGGYVLIADSDTNNLPAGILLEPQSYAVLARQLESENGSDSFEGYWGDSSGVWGDHESEDFLALDVAMTLSNNSGNVIIKDDPGIVLDEVIWETASDDGRSMERADVGDINSGWHDCFDPDGSTPGRENSIVPSGGESAFEVNIDPIVVSHANNGFDSFSIEVVIPPATKLTVKIYDETGYKVRSLIENSETNVLGLSWDGKDDNGKPLSPGIYLISFDLSGRSSKSKVCPVVIAP
ncbi:MAG: lamin tail domain-containing protein [Candidatus Zixiibacteriota bacterium]|nr:MAG: lamin tail domain-containing protein [candidate division Zixibacteria bacterium]